MSNIQISTKITTNTQRLQTRVEQFRRFARAPYQRSPDRAKSRLRRNTLANTSPLPPKLAALLTPSQLAYARLVVDETTRTGHCSLCLDEIAARIGTSSKTVQRAQQRLDELELISVELRPIKGQKNETNVVRIIHAEWLNWTLMGKIPRKLRQTIGGQRCPATANNFFLKIRNQQFEALTSAYERRRAAADRPRKAEPALEAALARLQNAIRTAADSSGT